MKSKSFRYLWLGQLLANFGDVFYIVGCISILYGFTSSAFYLAFYFSFLQPSKHRKVILLNDFLQ